MFHLRHQASLPEGSLVKRRTALLSIAAIFSLSAAGYAAASGRPPWHGQPSTTPPPFHHHHHGHDGDGQGGYGQGGQGGHGQGGQGDHGHGGQGGNGGDRGGH